MLHPLSEISGYPLHETYPFRENDIFTTQFFYLFAK